MFSEEVRLYTYSLPFCCCCSPRWSAVVLALSIFVTGERRGLPRPSATSPAAPPPHKVCSIGLVVLEWFVCVCMGRGVVHCVVGLNRVDRVGTDGQLDWFCVNMLGEMEICRFWVVIRGVFGICLVFLRTDFWILGATVCSNLFFGGLVLWFSTACVWDFI